MTTNKSVGCSNAPQETATDCGYVGLQAIVSTVGLFANKYITLDHQMEYYWELRSKNAQNIKALMCPLYKNAPLRERGVDRFARADTQSKKSATWRKKPKAP